ncbi:MAG: segregation/condensation protein A [Clostridiales Family XIII bacterium]|jgi:segregation and condensation protein A|nr:segregation/condensation protein A [Clostridiales Family XIII bacterium]
MAYKINLNIFEGPFDLLVYLIEQAEMSIYDIQISVITRQYLDHIKTLEESDVAVGADFMVLAATLIDIKSKMLLPRIAIDGTTEEDPRTDLVQKILQYTRFKKLAAQLEAQRELAALKCVKPQEDLQPYTGEPDVYLKMDMEHFIDAFQAFIYKKKKEDELRQIQGHIEREKITLESKIGIIKSLLIGAKNRLRSFRELLAPNSTRYDKVVTFIALLDLAKRGAVKVEQKKNFGGIDVSLLDTEKFVITEEA